MTPADARDSLRAAFFDQCAKGWEERNYAPEKLAQVEQMLRLLPLREDMDILDAGCGEGVLLPFLRRLCGEKTRLTALDASLPMLEGAAVKDPQTRLLHAEVEAIPLPDACMDMVVCFSAFPHFADKTAAAREFHRVLRPGGRAYVLHIDGRDDLNSLHDRHHAVEGDHLPCAHGMSRIFNAGGFTDCNLDEGPNHYYFTAVKQANHA